MGTRVNLRSQKNKSQCEPTVPKSPTNISDYSTPEAPPRRRRSNNNPDSVNMASSASDQSALNIVIERLDKMSNEIQQVNASLLNLEKSVNESNAISIQASEDVKKVNIKVRELEAKVDSLATENALLKTNFDKLYEKTIRLESHSRRDNLLFDGIAESVPENVEEKLRHIMRTILNLDSTDSMKIVRCHRLGRKQQHSTKPRTVIVKFHFYGDREQVWKSRSKLKNTNYWMQEDFPVEIKERRNILRPVMNAARRQNKHAILNVDQLLIEGKPYTVKTLGSLPEDLNPAHIHTPDVGEQSKAFFGGQSPLSNFHIAPFTIGLQRFQHVEQFYQYQKSVYAGDDAIGAAILQESSPEECFKLGLKLNRAIEIEEWHQNGALKAMEDGCRAKFSQNKHLADFLKSTKEKTLIEANARDLFWGVGIALKDKDKLKDKTAWKGKNMLGKILEAVREVLP